MELYFFTRSDGTELKATSRDGKWINFINDYTVLNKYGIYVYNGKEYSHNEFKLEGGEESEEIEGCIKQFKWKGILDNIVNDDQNNTRLILVHSPTNTKELEEALNEKGYHFNTYSSSMVAFFKNGIYDNLIEKCLTEDPIQIEVAKSNIWNYFVKLDAALNFLHTCLTNKPDDLSQIEGFDIETACKTGKAFGKNLEKLLNSLNRKPIDDTETFKALRDGILEMAGVK